VSEVFNAVKITDKVWWVGAIDWKIRDFHGYLTSRGTTYNAFLVMGEKITLIDTVKEPFMDEMLSRIRSVVDLSKIEYIVSNHAEMDHSGGLNRMAALCPKAEILASKMGVRALNDQLHPAYRIREVADGEKLDIGGLTLEFCETRMLHWPDSMFTYIPELKLLFSQDGFGMHLASSERFAREIDAGVLNYEFAKYYANILMLFAPFIKKTIAKLHELCWSLDYILPDHGPIWEKEDIPWVVERYSNWAEMRPGKKALVVYDTMWGSTAKMAAAIGEGLMQGGHSVKLLPLGGNHRSDVATEILGAGALLVGSPTINNNMFPAIADVLTYLKGLKPLNLIGGAFGSYGWGGEASAHVAEVLEKMGVEMPVEPLRIKYVPTDAQLLECRAFGEKIADALNRKIMQN